MRYYQFTNAHLRSAPAALEIPNNYLRHTSCVFSFAAEKIYRWCIFLFWREVNNLIKSSIIPGERSRSLSQSLVSQQQSITQLKCSARHYIIKNLGKMNIHVLLWRLGSVNLWCLMESLSSWFNERIYYENCETGREPSWCCVCVLPGSDGQTSGEFIVRNKCE